MKFLGVIMLVLSTTLIGFSYSLSIKSKIDTCDLIIDFCNKLIRELKYSQNSIINVIEQLNCSFINADHICNKKPINTNLSNDENKKILEFVQSLGKSNLESQILMIKGFNDYIVNIKQKYTDKYKSKSKVSLCLGVYLGIVFAIIII